MTDAVVWILLAIGMASFLVTAVGLLLIHDLYERIHYLSPGGIVGVLAIVAAIVVHESLSQAGVKAILIGVALFWMNPVLSHATARAARVRELGHWTPDEKENIQVE